MRSISGLRVVDVLPMGALLRVLLTFVAVADAFLSLQVWLLHGHHRYNHTAGEATLLALASLKIVGALVLAAVAVYLATRPKRAFRRILVLLAIFAALVALAASQRALVVIAVMDCLAALLASSLWPEVGDRRASRPPAARRRPRRSPRSMRSQRARRHSAARRRGILACERTAAQ